jgi:quercetin dioxygenase-like cupin family protein
VRRAGRAVAGLVVVACVAFGAGAGAGAAGGGKDAPPEATREILVQTQPAQAPGYELYLYRVTVPPGATIAPHTHPGTQAASIQRGVLTYTLISGSADVTRAQADGQPGTAPETVSGPTTVKLRRNDSVVENPQLVHEAANRGKQPVVILLSALLTAGAPLSEPATG